MTRETTENKYNSDCHRGKGTYFGGVVVIVVKKQDIQDSGDGGWQKFETWNCLHWVQDTYNYQRKPRISIYTSWTDIYTSWTEVLFIFYVSGFDLQHIEQKRKSGTRT